MSTALLAAAAVVTVAAIGAVAVSEGWQTTERIAVAVAAACVLISLAALSRAYFLCHLIQPVRVEVAPRPATTPAEPGPQQSTAEPWPPARPAALPPPAKPWLGPVALDSAQRDGPDLQREVFGKLAYRLQSLVNRLIHRIDQVEQEIEDPELLKSLYGIDHLATRIRRQIENLAVLGGESPQRRSDVPVDVNAVLRASIAEIEHYMQVTAVPIPNAKVQGHVVAEIIHLLAELLENATTFTTPDAPKVMLRAHRVTAGLAIQVQDRGIGMSRADINRINQLLDGSTRVDVAQLLQDGRIGLAVVESLARRHHIGAELQPNIFGGIDASIVVPHELLSEYEPEGVTPEDALPPPAAPRHAAPSSSRPASVPVGATAAPRLAAQPGAPAQSGIGDPLPATGPGTHEDEQQLAAPLPSRRRGESWANLRASGMGQPFDQAPAPAPTPTPAPEGDPAAFGDRQPDPGGRDPYRNPAPAEHPRTGERPALPQRRGSYMREELRERPDHVRPIPEHNPTLMASLLEGRAHAREEQPPSGGPGPDAPQPHHAPRNTKKDTARWQT